MMLHGHGLMAILACVCMSVQRKPISSSDLDDMINLHAAHGLHVVLGSSFFKINPTYARDSRFRRIL